MAFDFGAALTSAGTIPEAVHANRLEALELRRQQAADAALAEQRKGAAAYNQALADKYAREKQQGVKVRTYTSPDGATHDVYLTPAGYKDYVSEPGASDRLKAFIGARKEAGLPDLTPEQTQDALGKFMGLAPKATPETSDTRARTDYAKAVEGGYKGSFEQWKTEEATKGRVAAAPPKQDAFHEFLANPADYAKFLEAFEGAKAAAKAAHPNASKNASIMSLYAAKSILQMGYRENPAILPIASQMIGTILGQQGVHLTPDQLQVLATVPTDQPLSPTTGNPIGLSMPGAPTGATRSQAQTAQRVQTEMPRLRQAVTAAADSLGPAKGRLLIGFLLGQVGSTGDPAMDRQLSALRTDLTFAGSASAKFHINSVRQAEAFESLISAGKSPAEAIQGFLDSVQQWANTAAAQVQGYGERGGGQPSNGPLSQDQLNQILQKLQ